MRVVIVMLSLLLGASNAYAFWDTHGAINLTHKYGNGSGIKVGVLDEIAMCAHEQLSGKCNATKFVAGYAGDHGTHVSSIIAGKKQVDLGSGIIFQGGVAPGAHIYSYQIFVNADGPYWSDWLSDDASHQAVNDAVRRGIWVFNQSYGSTNTYGQPIFEPFEVALWRDFSDRVFVKAAGNSRAVRAEMADSVAGSVVNNVVFVGATDESGHMAYYSNSPGENCFLDGGSSCKEGNKYKYRYLVAPGDSVLSAFAGDSKEYGWMSGTSMAAPHVTGAVALIFDRWGHLRGNPQQALDILLKSATDLGKKGVDGTYGFGMLNIAAAMNDPIPIDPGDDDAGGGDDGGDECNNNTSRNHEPEPGTRSCHGDDGDNGNDDDNGGGNDDEPTNPDVPDDEVDDDEDVALPDVPDDDWEMEYCGWWCDWIGPEGLRLVGYYNLRFDGQTQRMPDKIVAGNSMRHVLQKVPVVFYDAYGRDFQTAIAKPRSHTSTVSEYMALSDTVALQMTSNTDKPNFKVTGDGVIAGRGRTLGLDHHAVLEELDDGAYVMIDDRIGVMKSDNASTVMLKNNDIVMTYTQEDNGFLGTSGTRAFSFGSYDTVSVSTGKDHGPFYWNAAVARSDKNSTGGRTLRSAVSMSDTIYSASFTTGVRGDITPQVGWDLQLGFPLQAVSGSMSVRHDNYQGQRVVSTYDMDDDLSARVMFTIRGTW